MRLAPGFPCALSSRRDNETAKPGRNRAAGMRTYVSVIARSDSDEAIHSSASRQMDCFASLAMTAQVFPSKPAPRRAKTRWWEPLTSLAGEPGFEPRQTESESVVLPLHHSPIDYPAQSIAYMTIRVNRMRRDQDKSLPAGGAVLLA